jgi:predicted GNAT family acetyltransferase
VESNLSGVAVVNNEQAHRFEATVDGYRALITYRCFPGKIVFDHAEVPPALEGKGLAAKLTRAALEFARAHGLRVVPMCPYVAAYIRRHPEEQDLLSPDDVQRIRSQSTNAAGK